MEHMTLLLNADYRPLKAITWQKAVSLWVKERIEIVESYDDFDLRSVSITIKCPAVVRLLKYVTSDNRRVKFSRINVFGRDQFTCQYCFGQPGTSELTYDHMLPRAQGGPTSWENIVTACIPCNSKKGNRTPEKASMPLKYKPRRPDQRPFYEFSLNIPKTPDAWRSYLYWVQELETDGDDK